MPTQSFQLSTSSGQMLAGLRFGHPEAQQRVLALHGWLDNAASFTRLGQALTDTNPDLQLVAMDFAGHGLSAPRPEGCRYHLLDNVDDVLEFADALEWQTFAVIGHSLGAGIAGYVAACFPERIHRLVLLEALGTQPAAPEDAAKILRQAVTDKQTGRKLKKPVYPSVADMITVRAASFSPISPESAQILCHRGTTACAGGYTWRSDPRLKMTSAMRLSEAQVQWLLSEIRCATLFIGALQGFCQRQDQRLQTRQACISQLEALYLPGNHHFHLEADSYEAMVEPIQYFLGVKEK